VNGLDVTKLGIIRSRVLFQTKLSKVKPNPLLAESIEILNQFSKPSDYHYVRKWVGLSQSVTFYSAIGKENNIGCNPTKNLSCRKAKNKGPSNHENLKWSGTQKG
jgi:hypothetical protein